MSDPETPAPSPGRFATTCWTQVLAARGDSSEGRDALAELCEHYYEPVLAFLCRSGEIRVSDARDLAHDFFAELLRGHRLDKLEREKGRFRSYLLGALKHFLSHHWARNGTAKRGGKAVSVSLNETGIEEREGAALQDGRTLPPDSWFDRHWAINVLDHALTALEAESEAEGKLEQFRLLTPWLTGEAEHGDQADLAERMGVPASTLKSLVHRVRRRFRAAVRNEIGRTLSESADIETEMAALFEALGDGVESGKKP